jgi:beta-galactosidase beta subunit
VSLSILTINLHALPLGRYDLENGVFANVQEYFTKEESVYEAHKPCISVCGNPSEVRKVVVKIPVK